MLRIVFSVAFAVLIVSSLRFCCDCCVSITVLYCVFSSLCSLVLMCCFCRPCDYVVVAVSGSAELMYLLFCVVQFGFLMCLVSVL